MSDRALGIHPEAQRLMEECALLREELAARLAELHDLEHIVRPNLLALFQTKLGPWELRLLQAQGEAARLKRKAQLVQASFNRGEAPDVAAIEAKLEAEFLAWQQRVQEAAAQVAAAQFRLSHLLAPEDSAALKKAYRDLVKNLHPDLHPELAEAAKALWLQVVAAYEAHDLQKLKALALVAVDGTPPPAPETMAMLRDEHQRLRAQVRRLIERLAEIEQEPPFSLRRQWKDEDWIAQRRGEIETAIGTAQAEAEALERHLAALLILYGSGQQQFGPN